MVSYEFGVGSSKYSCECDDVNVAEVSMCLFIKADVPIVVYSPEKKAFKPMEILEKNLATADGDKIKKCMATIKQLV